MNRTFVNTLLNEQDNRGSTLLYHYNHYAKLQPKAKWYLLPNLLLAIPSVVNSCTMTVLDRSPSKTAVIISTALSPSRTVNEVSSNPIVAAVTRNDYLRRYRGT